MPCRSSGMLPTPASRICLVVRPVISRPSSRMLPEEERLQISNSLRYVRQYCEMPLKILKAEQLVGGEDAFDQILNRLFNRELDPMYPYLTYQDFLNACGLAEEDLNLD